MNDPLVSVITPSYQQGEFIRATIDSVLGQDYPAIELIVIDGGSTDTTLDVLRGISDTRFSWVSEKDRGQTDAINKGLRRASGEILTYLNSDDLLLPGAVRFTVDYFKAHPDVQGMFGDAYLINEHGKTMTDFKARPYSIVSAITGGTPNPQQGTFWRRSVMDTIGLFDDTLRYCMDFEYWLRMALAGCELRYVPGFRGAFRLHGASKTVSQAAAFDGELKSIYDALYARPDLPAEVRASQADAQAYLDWRRVKDLYMQHQYAEMRRMLAPFLRGRRRGRQMLAALMMVDSRLHTPLARLFSEVYYRWRGAKLLPD